MRKILVLLFFVVRIVYAADPSTLPGYWTIGGVNYGSLPAPSGCVSNDYYIYANLHWVCSTSTTCTTKADRYPAPPYTGSVVHESSCGAYASFTTCPEGAVFDGVGCSACPSGQSVNYETNKCDMECPSGQEWVASFNSCLMKCDMLHVRNDQGYCVADCNYETQEELNDQCYDKCPEGTTRGADMQCHCPAGKEYFQGQCVVSCAQGEIRDSQGMCKPNCGSGEALINGQCVPETCPDGQELQQGQCVDHPTNPNCGEGEVSDQNGMCVPACESGAMIGGQCADVNCPDSQYLKNGKCVNRDNTVNCPAGMRTSADGKSCVNLECPVGQVVSYLQNKCVDDPTQNSCPVGTHKEGILCVPDNKDCPLNTHWEAGCKKCVRDGSPIGVCGGVAGDMDGDGVPDSSDDDIDGDGIPNASDSDADGDGIPNSTDSDDDNDGIPDANDLTPRGPGTTNPDIKCVGPNCDTDGDGIPDHLDPDKDGDGIPDDQETEKAGGPGGTLGDLYEVKGLTLSKVWQDFSIRVSQAPIVVASSSFFMLPYFSANCPVWTFPATAFSDPIVFNYFCDPAVTQALQLAGIVVLLVAAWVAFRIAIL